MTGSWRKLRRFFVNKVLHADDTPHRIALGVAVGVLVGFSPTIGFQMIIAFALATAIGANKIVAIPMVWITNPVTIIPIYASCARLGAGLLGSTHPGEGIASVARLERLIAATRAGGYGQILTAPFWKELLASLTRLGGDLWVGCLAVGIVGAGISYFVTRWWVTEHRRHRAERIEARAKRRAEKSGFVKRSHSRERSNKAPAQLR